MIFVKGKNEARRLIVQGAVSVDGEKIDKLTDYVLIDNVPSRVKWGKINKIGYLKSREPMIIKILTLLTHDHGNEPIMLDENRVEI